MNKLNYFIFIIYKYKIIYMVITHVDNYDFSKIKN